MLPIALGKNSAVLIFGNALLEREFLHANSAGQRCELTFIHHYPV